MSQIKTSPEEALEDLMTFRTVAGKGIKVGQINRTIHPIPADHVLRKALKSADELKRVESGQATRK